MPRDGGLLVRWRSLRRRPPYGPWHRRAPAREVSLPMGRGGYALIEKLATGGMAELYVGRRVGPNAIVHPVVIKRLRPEMERDPSMVQMFLWEAWISARLHHPNVVRFHDFVCYAGRHHLVLEHVAGCDLAAAAQHLAATGRPFPIAAAIEIGIGVLRALAHAHALPDDDGRPVGLVHRDVSPQNVLLSIEGDIKLADFGVAKTSALTTRDSGAGLVKGKLGYLAPEQLRGQPVDARADLFGVGVILFELLTGRRLFQGEDDGARMRAALAGEVPAIAPLRPGCPALLEEVVRRALSREPGDRFEGAAQMADALLEVQGSLGTDPGARAVAQTLAALVREVAAVGELPVSSPVQPGPPADAATPARDTSGSPVDRDRATIRLLAPRSGEPASCPREPEAPRAGVAASVGPEAPAAMRRSRLLPWIAVAVLAFAAGATTAHAVSAWCDRMERHAPAP